MTPWLSRMREATLVTDDLDGAVADLERTVGLRASPVETWTGGGSPARVVPIGPFHLVVTQPLSGDHERRAFLHEKGPGIHSVAFAVTDRPTAESQLRRSGIVSTVDPATGRIVVGDSVAGGFRLELSDDFAHHGDALGLNPIFRDCWNLSVVVRELDETLERYEAMFRLPTRSEGESERWGYRQRTLALADENAGHGIEILTSLHPDRHPARFLAERGEGVYLLTISVDSLEAACPRLLKDPLVTVDEDSDPSERYLWFHPRTTARVFLCLSQRVVAP